MWYRGDLPWAEFVAKVIELISGPVAQGTQNKFMTAQDSGGYQHPPIHDWEKFERFCRDLFAKIWKNEELKLNGRSGQPQAGVDVFGVDNSVDGSMGGIQCKKRDTYADKSLKVKEIEEIVETAKQFTPKLNKFVIAYTGPRDANLQKEANRVSELNKSQGLFTVQLFSWDDVEDSIGAYPDILERYFPYLFSVSAEKIQEMKEELKKADDLILKNQTHQSDKLAKIQENTADIPKFIEMAGALADFSGVVHEYNAELNEIRDLLNTHRPQEALERISELEKRISHNVDKIVKFRLITNKAAALNGIGESKKAGTLFIEAYQYKPDDERAQTNKALGYLLIGQKEEAIKQANVVLEKNPLSEEAHQIVIYSSPSTIEEIIEKIPQVLRDTEAITISIAQAAHEKGDLQNAIKWLELATKKSQNPNAFAYLGACLLESLQEKFGTPLSLEDQQKLEKVINVFTKAIGILDRSATLALRSSWFVNRSSAYRLLNNLGKALADIDTALFYEPNNPQYLKLKAMLLYEMRNATDAVDILRNLISNEAVPEAPLLLAGILFDESKIEDALKILEDALARKQGPQDLLIEEKRLQLRIYLKLEQYDKAKKVSEELISSDPTNILSLVEAARIERVTNSPSVHTSLLEEAIRYVVPNTPRRHLLELAEELYFSERYLDAWPLYEKLVDVKAGGDLVNKLIYSYYKAEQYDKALSACQIIPGAMKEKFVFEIELSIRDAMGDLKNAIQICREYLSKNPKDTAFKIRFAILLLRDTQYEKLDELLKEKIDIHSLPKENGFEVGKQLVWLYSERKMYDKAIEMAYALRQRFIKEGAAHVFYVQTFFILEKELKELSPPSEVSVNVVVTMKDDSGERIYVIEDDPDLSPGVEYIKSDSQIAQKVMGKKINDEIIIPHRIGEEKFTIRALKNKYIHALHESMTLFSQLSPDAPDLVKIPVKIGESPEKDKEELKSILDLVSERNNYILEIQKLYEENKIPLGTFATLVRQNVINVWGGLVNDSSVGIHACLGTLLERQDALKIHEAIKKGEHKSVAVDLSALLTCGSIDCLDMLKTSFDEILVTQSTIDVISDAISEVSKHETKGFMTLSKEGNQYYRHEITPEQINKQISFLTKLRDWINKNCKKLPSTNVLKLGKERRKQLEEILGKSSLDTILLAQEKKCLFYSDDFCTRASAKNEFNVPGIWTQIFALIAADRKFITIEEYEKITLKLSLLNYKHTAISGKTLLEAAKQSNWNNQGSFQAVLTKMNDLKSESKSLCVVAVDFFYLLWKEPIFDSRREALVIATLDAISDKRDKTQILKIVETLIRARFRMVPLWEKALLKLLTVWRSLRF